MISDVIEFPLSNFRHTGIFLQVEGEQYDLSRVGRSACQDMNLEAVEYEAVALTTRPRISEPCSKINTTPDVQNISDILLRSLSPRANYNDRAAAAGRRS